MALMYHDLAIYDLAATFSHLSSHYHILWQFNHAGCHWLARTMVNLHARGYLTTIYDPSFTRQQVLDVIEDTIASLNLLYRQGHS